MCVCVIAEADAGAEDGSGDVIELLSLPGTAEVPLARPKEKKKTQLTCGHLTLTNQKFLRGKLQQLIAS